MAGKHLLLVDDNPLFRETTRKQLESEGANVSEAENGFQALQKLEELRPDALITDIVMPDMEGIGLLLEMKKRKFQIPTLVVSGGGYASEDYLSAAKCLASCETLLKPFSISQLRTALHSLLSSG